MNRRKSPFVKHHLQWTYLRMIIFAMVVPVFISTACLYYVMWQTIARELAIPELIAQALFPAFKQVNRVIILGLPIACFLILFTAVKLSNRFAGPIYRIEKELDDIIMKNDFHKNIRIRPGDQVHGLVSKINHALHLAHRHHKLS